MAKLSAKKWAPWAVGGLGLLWLMRSDEPANSEEGLPEGEGEAGPQPRKTVKTVGRVPSPGIHRSKAMIEEDLPPRADTDLPVDVKKFGTMYASGGGVAKYSVDVPFDHLPASSREYFVVVRITIPDIGYAVKLGGQKYGIGQGPPGSTPLLTAVTGAVNVALGLGGDVVGQAAGSDPRAAAVAAALKMLQKVAAAIPGIVKKARVKVWGRFTAGQWGKKSVRKKVRAATSKWYSKDRFTSWQASSGELRGYWRYQNGPAGVGEWPMVDDDQSGLNKPTPAGSYLAPQPVVTASAVGDSGYVRISVTTTPSAYAGMLRYDVSVYN
jgi:hypothetical protein